MLVPLCRHIKTNGIRCKSPAINRLPYCYYHFRSLQRHRPYRYPSNAKDYAIKPLIGTLGKSPLIVESGLLRAECADLFPQWLKSGKARAY